MQRRVLLFKQLLPLGGNLPDRVSEALQAILTEKNYPGRVNYLREVADQNGGHLTAIGYRVEEVTLQIRGFEFPGASPEQAALLTTAVRRAVGGNYARSALAAVAKFDLLPVYLQRGYLKAAFGPANARVVPQPSAAAGEPAPLGEFVIVGGEERARAVVEICSTTAQASERPSKVRCRGRSRPGG